MPTLTTLPEKAEFSKQVRANDVDEFAKLSGDSNPLHTDDSFASRTTFGRRVAHGMFLASLFSRMVGMELGTPKLVYLSQTLQFRSPVFIGDEVVVAFRKISESQAASTVTYESTVSCKGKLCVSGTAVIKLL